MRLGDLDTLKIEILKLADSYIKDDDFFTKVMRTIDNAPTINPSFNLDNITEEEIEKFKIIWQRANSKGLLAINEERPQSEFTDLEREVIADSINYLLGAELLEENGYTEEVIAALKSVLSKIGADMRGKEND